MENGKRIYYNQLGEVVFIKGESSGYVVPYVEDEIIQYIDLPFGDTALDGVLEFHIDVESKSIIPDSLYERVKTPEEKIKELEDELLITGGVI